MPTQIVDDFGAWDDLGSVEPVFEQWLTFPDFTYSVSSLLRLYFNAERFDKRTYAYIRCRYEVTNNRFYGRWVKVYPKAETEVIIYPHPLDLAGLKSIPKRVYQIQKRHRARRYNGTFDSFLWDINLQVCNENLGEDNEQQRINDGFPSAYFLNLL